MKCEPINVDIVIESTGNLLRTFKVSLLGEAPHCGDALDVMDTLQLSGVVNSRSICYYPSDETGLRPITVKLLVRFSVENWLYLWQEIVGEIKDQVTEKDVRKSNKFLSRHASINDVHVLLNNCMAFGIDMNGQNLLENYIHNYYEQYEGQAG